MIKEKLKIGDVAVHPKEEQPAQIDEIITDLIEKGKEKLNLNLTEDEADNKIDNVLEIKDDIILFDEKMRVVKGMLTWLLTSYLYCFCKFYISWRIF